MLLNSAPREPSCSSQANKGARALPLLGSSVLTLHLWYLEAPNSPRWKKEKDFGWTGPGNRESWSPESALWSRNLYSQSWLHMAAPHLPQLCTASAGQGMPETHVFWEKKQKVGELTGTEGYTDSVHPLWRSYQGNSFPYDLFWETWSPRKAARYNH